MARKAKIQMELEQMELERNEKLEELQKRRPSSATLTTKTSANVSLTEGISLRTMMMDLSMSHSHIINEIMSRMKIRHDDWKDVSLHPSYTRIGTPYHVICLARYNKSKERYEAQLQKEVKKLLNVQTNACDMMRLTKHMAITTLWPPLHTRLEIENFHQNFFRFTREEKRRLDFIMGNEVI